MEAQEVSICFLWPYGKRTRSAKCHIFVTRIMTLLVNSKTFSKSALKTMVEGCENPESAWNGTRSKSMNFRPRCINQQSRSWPYLCLLPKMGIFAYAPAGPCWVLGDVDGLHTHRSSCLGRLYHGLSYLHGPKTVDTRRAWLFVEGYGSVETLDLPLA